MKLKLEIEMDNDAFQTPPNVEIARILTKASERVLNYGFTFKDKVNLMDSNGNKVGYYIIKR
jgi:hypothetical protein